MTGDTGRILNKSCCKPFVVTRKKLSERNNLVEERTIFGSQYQDFSLWSFDYMDSRTVDRNIVAGSKMEQIEQIWPCPGSGEC